MNGTVPPGSDGPGLDGLPEDLLSAYLDGECTAAQRAAVEARLVSDPEWQSVLDDVGAARAAVRALPVRDAPPEFWARVFAGVDEAGPHVDELARRRGRRVSRWLAGGAAAASIVVAVAVAVPQRRPDATPELPALATSHAGGTPTEVDPVSAFAPIAVVPAGFTP